MSEKESAQVAAKKDAEIVEKFADRIELTQMMMKNYSEAIDLLNLQLGDVAKSMARLSKSYGNCGRYMAMMNRIIKICGEELRKAKNGEKILSLADIIKLVKSEKEDTNTYGS